MVALNKSFLEKKAQETGFVRDTLEKVYRLIDVLEYISENPFLSNKLTLKGGTAINLFVFDMPRLSVDIDLDYSRNVARESMLEERRKINEEIDTFIQLNDYRRSPNSRSSHTLDSIVISYENKGGNKDLIKLEINYSLRAHVLPLQNKEIIPEIFSTIFAKKSSKTLHELELFASKISALLNRTAIRDLYDIDNMIKSNIITRENRDIFKRIIIFYHVLTSNHPELKLEINRIEDLSRSDVRTGLNPVIRNSEDFELLPGKNRVRSYLEDLLVLSQAEEKFIAEFKQNNYLPELLFADKEIIERIKEHPMAIWRTKERDR